VASLQLSGLQQGGLAAIVSELAQEAIPADTDAVVPGADAVNLEDLLSDDDDDLPEIQDSEPTQTYALPRSPPCYNPCRTSLHWINH
jgi:hypothetical protein